MCHLAFTIGFFSYLSAQSEYRVELFLCVQEHLCPVLCSRKHIVVLGYKVGELKLPTRPPGLA